MIKVVATKLGYFEGSLVNPGQELILKDKKGFKQDPSDNKKLEEITIQAEKQFSKEWMMKHEDFVEEFESEKPQVKRVKKRSSDESVI